MLSGVPSQGLFLFLFKIIATLIKTWEAQSIAPGEWRTTPTCAACDGRVCFRLHDASTPAADTASKRATPCSYECQPLYSKKVCNETRPRCTKQNGKSEKGKGRLRRRRENYILIHFIVFNSFNTRLLSSSVAETLK